MKYLIKSGAKSFATRYCAVGKYNNRGHNKANLIIKVDGVGASELYVNAEMLREALITNPEVVKELLGLQVKDLRAIEMKKEAEVKEATEIFETIVEEPKVTILEEPKIVAPKPAVKKTQPKKVEEA
jgi:hypothetical protein